MKPYSPTKKKKKNSPYQTSNQHYYITTQSNQNVILRERERERKLRGRRGTKERIVFEGLESESTEESSNARR